jgi:hypothetical protein
MVENKLVEQCPQCKHTTFKVLEDCPWVRYDKVSGKGLTEHLFIKRCTNADCLYEDNGLERQKQFIIQIAYNNDLDENPIEETQVEILETDIEIIFRRIEFYFKKEKWVKCKQYIDQILAEHIEFLSLISNEYKLLKLFVEYRNNKSDSRLNYKNILNSIKPNLNLSQRLHDILKLLFTNEQELNYEEFVNFKIKYFNNYLYLHVDYSLIALEKFKPIIVEKESRVELLTWFESLISDKIIIELTMDVLWKYRSTEKWPSDEVIFLEKACHALIPTKDNKDGDSLFYRLFKINTNQYAFNILLEQDKLKEAFRYLETIGMDYIPNEYTEYLMQDMEAKYKIDPHDFPFFVEYDDWVCDPGTEAWTNLDRWDLWVFYLRYLTAINFYEQQLKDISKKTYHGQIKVHMIELTESVFLPSLNNNIYINESWGTLKKSLNNFKNPQWDSEQESKQKNNIKISWEKNLLQVYHGFIQRVKTPPIVAEIYEEKGEWLKALEYYKKSNISEDQKREVLNKFSIDPKLFSELRQLSFEDQKQALAFTRLIIRTEPLLRDFVRRTLKRKGIPLDVAVRNIINDLDERKFKNQIPKLILPSTERKDELELLFFPELIQLMISKKYYSLFQDKFQYKNEWIAIQTQLTPIRNNLAHAIPITDLEFDYMMAITDRIGSMVK